MYTLKKIDIHAHVTSFPEWVPVQQYSGCRWLSTEEQIKMYDRRSEEHTSELQSLG